MKSWTQLTKNSKFGKTKIMKQKFGKWFVLVPIGLIIISGTLLLTQFKYLSDMLSGLLFGVGIGLMALALILRKRKPTSC